MAITVRSIVTFLGVKNTELISSDKRSTFPGFCNLSEAKAEILPAAMAKSKIDYRSTFFQTIKNIPICKSLYSISLLYRKGG
jgi:hypothetical protein